MNFFKKIAEKLGFNDNETVFSTRNRTQEINARRFELRETMVENLKRIHFTEAEIKEVTDILDKCEQMVQVVKDDLLGTNINNPQPDKILEEKIERIREFEMKAADDIRAKIAEIRARKGEI